MRRVFWRGTKILAVAVLLLTPVAALADDPAIQPPLPQASSPARQATFWQIVRIVLLNA
jgi:hypothetical protein